MSGKSEVKVLNSRPENTAERKQNVKVPLTCAAEMRIMPAAFTLAEPMKDPGSQLPTASYTFGMNQNSFSDWDW